MKAVKHITTTIITSLLMIACGGTENTEETEETTVETNEEADTTVISELEPQTIQDLDNETFKSYWEEKGGVLIDLRTPEEVEGGSIAGAVNIDFNAGEFDNAIDTLDSTVPTFVYCQGGGRSGNARDMLKEKGFLEVYNLTNGYGNWTE